MSYSYTDAKDPSDSTWWSFDTTGIITADRPPGSVTLTTAVWTLPVGLALVGSSIVANVAWVRIAGGTAGTTYDLMLDFVSSTTEIYQRTIRLKVKQL